MHPLTLDEADAVRHREITTKAVSAILLLTLKWFKVSREHDSFPRFRGRIADRQ